MQWISCNRLEPSLYVGVRGFSLNPDDKPILPVGVTPGARGQKHYKNLVELKAVAPQQNWMTTTAALQPFSNFFANSIVPLESSDLPLPATTQIKL